MIRYLIQSNYAVLIMCVLMLIYLGIDRSFERRVRNLFALAVWSVLFLTIMEAIDICLPKQELSPLLQNCMTAFGTAFKPLPIFCLAMIIRRYRAKQYYWMAIPFGINIFLSLCYIPSGIYFVFDKSNFFFFTFITYAPYLVCFFYMFVLVALTLLEYRQNGIAEMLTVFMIAIVTLVATVMESLFSFEFILNVTMISGLLFYYLFLHVQIYKRDSLTNLLNRRSFYLDASDNLENPMTIVEIDLNNLKKINDSKGHSAGDAAILVVVNVIKSIIGVSCTLYRTGGDEFMLLGIKKSEFEMNNLLLRATDILKETEYRISYGIASYDPGMSLERVVKLADENMYKMKRDSKQGRNDSEKKS